MSNTKCNVCEKNLTEEEENLCTQCELKEDDDEGDVPNNVNCGACKYIVEEDSEGLSCDICNTWYHNICCENPLIEGLYSLLNEAPQNVKWFCDECIWETEKWFNCIRATRISGRVCDKEQKYDNTAHTKEPEIKIEIQNEGLPIIPDDSHSTDSEEYKEKKVKKKKDRTLMKNSYQCNQCKKSFSYKSSFKKHMKLHNGKKPFTCIKCDIVCADIDDLEKHLKTHIGIKTHKCNYCGKVLSSRTKLIIHERIHTGERPFQCIHCGKAFHQQNHLIKHERVHTGEKPYPCGHCDKVFTRPDNLKNHERIHSGEKPYQCGHCGKVFARQDNFKTHERIHTGEKPYQCDQCEKRFRAMSGLREHFKTHTGEKPYQCNQCGKCFRDVSCRRQHMRTHTGKEPFQITSSVTALPIGTQPNSILPVPTTTMPDSTKPSIPLHNSPITPSITHTAPMSLTSIQSHPIFTSSSSSSFTSSHQIPISLMPTQPLAYLPRRSDQNDFNRELQFEGENMAPKNQNYPL